MCSAMPRRMADMASTVSPSWAPRERVPGPALPREQPPRRLCGRGRRSGGQPVLPAPRPAAAALAGLDEAQDVLLRDASAPARAGDPARRPRRARRRSGPRPARRSARRRLSVLGLDRERRGRGLRGGRLGRCRDLFGRRRLALRAGGCCALGGRLLRGGLGRRLCGGCLGLLRLGGRRLLGRRALGAFGRDHRDLRPDRDRLALLHQDLLRRRRSPGSAPRCRPCRSRSRAASRRPRSPRPRTSTTS